MANILLRDIPKVRAGLDLADYPIQGGFRGFQNVLQGYHLVRVWPAADGRPVTAEVVVPELRSVAVLIWEGDGLVVDSSSDGQQLAELAASGAMNARLVNALAPPARAVPWMTATSALDGPIDGVSLAVPQGVDNRFRALFARHGEGLLMVVQAAFARAVRDDDLAPLSALLAAYECAGERGVKAARDHLLRFAPAYVAMRALVPQVMALGNLLEDMADVGKDEGDAALVEAASAARAAP
jgi:hypothetical protein